MIYVSTGAIENTQKASYSLWYSRNSLWVSIMAWVRVLSLWRFWTSTTKKWVYYIIYSQEDIFKRLILFWCSCPLLDHKETVFKYDLMYSHKFYIFYIQYILCIELVMAASEIFVFKWDSSDKEMVEMLRKPTVLHYEHS